MTNVVKRFFFIFRLSLIVIVAALAVLFLINRFFTSEEASWSFLRLLLAAGFIGVFSVPVFIFLSIRLSEKEGIEAVTVSEMILSQEEIARAVDLWVYSRYHKSLQGDIEFSQGEEGINCRVHVEE